MLAVMLQPGAGLPNPCLEAALTSAPIQPGVEVPLNKPISLLSLLPKPRSADGRRPYATYSGALTSQPCSGGVQWVVFLDPLKVQAEQVSGELQGVLPSPPCTFACQLYLPPSLLASPPQGSDTNGRQAQWWVVKGREEGSRGRRLLGWVAAG